MRTKLDFLSLTINEYLVLTLPTYGKRLLLLCSKPLRKGNYISSFPIVFHYRHFERYSVITYRVRLLLRICLRVFPTHILFLA